MLKYLLQGLLVGLAYVAPIGAQNLYVINTAMLGNRLKTLQIVIITILFDVSLGVSCFFGIGYLIDKLYILKILILLFGSIGVTYIGLSLIRSSSQLPINDGIHNSLLKTIATCFAVTWLNPQAIIDGTLLLGGIRTSLPLNASNYFIIGASSASFIWFSFLAIIISVFSKKFYQFIKWINIICGGILLFYGMKLGYSFIVLLIK